MLLTRVIQRWHWLLAHTDLSTAAAYDKARTEHYRVRHHKEVQARVAREEAQHVGAYFGPGPLEIGDILEDKAYENWKQWAIKETQELKALQSSSYGATGVEDESTPDEQQEGLQEVADSVPASRAGQTARGGAAFRV